MLLCCSHLGLLLLLLQLMHLVHAVRANETAVAWRAVIEQADDQTVRAFGVNALTECAVTAARWRRLMGETPVTVAFPGGSE